MEAEFRQDLTKRVLTIKRTENPKFQFREKMAVKNRIRGFAGISVKHLNGEAFYCYDMGPHMTLKSFFEGRKLKFDDLKQLLTGISSAAAEAEKYLLDFRDFLMDPGLVLWDEEKRRPVFCYYPGNPEGEKGYEEMGLFIIDTVDKDDEAAVKAAYEYYERITEGLFLPDDILKRVGGREEPLDEADGTAFGALAPGDGVSGPYPGDSAGLTYQDPESSSGNFYLDSAKEEEEEEESVNPAILILTLVPALISSVLYAFFFLDPERLAFLGLTDRDYIRSGVVLTVVSGLFITIGVYCWNRRRVKKKEESG